MLRPTMPLARRAMYQRGFSLIELMIAMAIGLMIGVAVLSVAATSFANRRTDERSTDLQNAGRYALQVIKQDLQHAGFRGLTWESDKDTVISAATAVANDCGSGTFATNIMQPIWGANDTNAFAATCIPAGRYDRGDVLVIRRVSQATVDVASPTEAAALHFRSAYPRSAVFAGAAVPNVNPPFGVACANSGWCMAGKDFQDHRIELSIYYVGTCSTGPVTKGLCRVRLAPGPSMQTELVAKGIENLQVRYGQAQWNTAQVQYEDASNVAGTATNLDKTEWNNVTSVRLWLLAKAETSEPGPSLSASYDMGDQTQTVSDGYRRQVFSTVVNLRNNWTD